MTIWQHVRVIAWAQFRTSRNHLPRTTVGGLLMGLLSALWYGMFIFVGALLALELPDVSASRLSDLLPAGLLGIFLFWQIIPLFTLSTGWSLQVNKLRVYPVSDAALFLIEAVLRITTAPEMIPIIFGAIVGLMRNGSVPFAAPLWLLVFIPLNLLLSLGIREFILHSFSKSRFREVLAIFIISVAVLPQVLVRSTLGARSAPYLLRLAHVPASPWQQTAALALTGAPVIPVLGLVAWLALAWIFARRQFRKTLVAGEEFRSGSALISPRLGSERVSKPSFSLAQMASRIFRDPLGALIEKELRSLLRMPRFRVIFGMACVLGSAVFIPMALDARVGGRNGFMRDNFLSVVILYGLLLMSQALLLNAFGLDRRAAQIYFIAPVPFSTVLRAKNVTAIIFVVLQSLAVIAVAAIVRVSFTATNIVNAISGAAVIAVFLLCVGNLLSVHMPGPVDATETFRKQAGGKMQLYMLLCAIGMFLLIGFGFLARYAFGSNWALLGVLGAEFLIGLVTYRIATQSAMETALRERERILEALSRGTQPVGTGLL